MRGVFESCFDPIHRIVGEIFMFRIIVNVRMHGMPREDRVFVDIVCRDIIFSTAIKESFVDEP